MYVNIMSTEALATAFQTCPNSDPTDPVRCADIGLNASASLPVVYRAPTGVLNWSIFNRDLSRLFGGEKRDQLKQYS